MTADTYLAWVAIGAAASLAGMIWAFRRGVAGVLANFAAGIGGAILGGLIGYAVAQHRSTFGGPAIPGIPAPAGPPQLFFAAVGAICGLVLLHLAWLATVRARRAHPIASR
jgi:hypothetical protein